MYDIIVVGGGPAGMTAAIYARRANKKVLVFEGKACGGQILNATEVDNYPGFESISGFDLSQNMYNQALKLGAEFKFEMVKKITADKKVITDNGEYQAKAIILATGAENRRLNIVEEADYIGRGISYCATCDGNFYKGKDVAVVGGGNTALEDALYLSNLCNKVYLIHRRDQFRGEDKYVEQIKLNDNIELILNSQVVDLIGEEHLEKVTVKNNDETTKTIDVSGLFIAVGQQPRNEMFADVVEIDEKGYIKAHDEVYTNVEGIYVAGDTRNKVLKQLTTAVSDGSLAATIAIKEMK
ncbi:MAG: thioredoxin-disulfide reductase [Firmicutes bacterium]|jgi:thioredoxin reductase (NADPH)|nr:thioredoxin-disulfide reductase [Bacillota bacterium]